MTTKTGVYSIVGRPNVGKSTLLNALAGEKVAIVTDKPQTTRGRITAVKNRGDCQLIFMDTPGFHRATTKLGDYMNRVVHGSVADVDAVVLVVEPVQRIGKPEALLIEKIAASGLPAVLAVNKLDTVDKDRFLAVIDAYRNAFGFTDYVPLSARAGEGVELLCDVLEPFAAEGPQLYPDDMVSDQPERQMTAEIIREKLLLTLDKEVPHGVAVVIETFKQRDRDDVIEIGATIYCERESHKGIIIGKNGARLKEVGALARAELEAFFGAKVFLETWVKVKEDWRKSDMQVKNFGYDL